MTDQHDETTRDTERPPAPQTLRFIGDVGPLFEALAKAQAEFVEMERDAAVSFDRRTFKYATLAEVLASVRPALNKYGLAILQPFDTDKVTTILALGSNRIEVDVHLLRWDTPQILGSELTYIKRYQLKSLLGVNDGEDDDGNAASGTGKTPEPRQRATPPTPGAQPAPPNAPPETMKAVGNAARALGWKTADLEGFSVDHGCGKLAELNPAKAGALLKLLEAAVTSNAQPVAP